MGGRVHVRGKWVVLRSIALSIALAGACGGGDGASAPDAPSTITGDVTNPTVTGFLGGRRVSVYLPPGYHGTTDRFPVLYMLDGQHVFQDTFSGYGGEWNVDETLQALIPAGEVAPFIVVAVDNGGASGRTNEYTPWMDGGDGGGAAAHLAAIADVLVPYVNASYRTLTGPANTGIGGSSLGGLMALYATYARPDVFGNNAALSPSIGWAGREIVDFAAGSTRPAARVWMDMGTAEGASSIADLHLMRDAMVNQGFVLGEDLNVVEDSGAEHNVTAWARRFRDVARFLFPAR